MTEQEKINAILQMGVGRTNLGINEESKIVLKALEKQIPKVPNYEGDGYADGAMVYDVWRCPNCDRDYEVEYDDYDYCPNCGQHIDWGNEDDRD